MKKNICVYCGASDGVNPIYQKWADLLGKEIAHQGRRLIYGGGKKGLMGIVANGALSAGGEVIGVMPKKLVEAEIAHTGITKLEIVEDMHQRKAKLIELSDAFIAMPGGTGTLEEFFEVWTWAQIGYHKKPVALFELNQFWQPLCHFLEQVVSEGFIRESFYKTLIVENNIPALFNQIDNYIPKDLERWIKK